MERDNIFLIVFYILVSMHVKTSVSLDLHNGANAWSYDDTNDAEGGPSHWYKHFSKCNGSLQSPVDITGTSIKYKAIPPMTIRTLDNLGTTPIRIKNDGKTLAVIPANSNVIIEGGDLPGTYVVVNLHFHWGLSDIMGSEHKLDGRYYALERHMVTLNSKYQNIQEAAGTSDGIHVIAVLYEISELSNMDINFVTSKLDGVIEPGTEIDGGTMSINNLLPSSTTSFYRYVGSLTTPPCTENVIWSVYASPQTISSEQLKKFQNLKLGTKDKPLEGANIRPVQSTNNRTVFTNNNAFLVQR